MRLRTASAASLGFFRDPERDDGQGPDPCLHLDRVARQDADPGLDHDGLLDRFDVVELHLRLDPHVVLAERLVEQELFKLRRQVA